MTESRAALSDEAAMDKNAFVAYAERTAAESKLHLPIPIHDYVLLKILPKGEQTTDSGLVIPDVVADEPMEGEVVAAGLGRTLETGAFLYMDARIVPGVRVLYAKFAGFELEVDRTKYRMLRAEEILGVYQ